MARAHPDLRPPRPQAIVIFGASGDLAYKKILPALYDLAVAGLLPERYVVIGFARTEYDDEGFRARARAAVEEAGRAHLTDDVWEPFARSLTYIQGSATDPESMKRLAAALDDADRHHECDGGRIYYLAVPPNFFAEIVRALDDIGANTPGSRLVVEKPFGDSLESARELNEAIHRAFDERQVFRIDHYLGKETVQNLVAFRFANALFERVWNRDAIDSVEITVAEPFGIGGRAGYYESAGAIRDLLQNHMLQVLAFLSMEPPRSLESEGLRDEVAKLLATVRPLDPAEVVRGQYEGYRNEEGVDPESQTETFVAARLWIDNWRWDDVPFFLRHGKKLPTRITEITVTLRKAPDYLFTEIAHEAMRADHLTIRATPDEGISLAFQAKTPGPGFDLTTVRMNFEYEGSFTAGPADAYDRLLHDAMIGDHSLFIREDAVDRAWEIVTPVLEHPPSLHLYPDGSWGPDATEELIAPRHWHTKSV
jgi:glucose-6-phosphate 1-dehydrogenase